MPAQIGILVGPKSQGSNMLAIARACADGEIPGEVRVVVAPTLDCPASLNAVATGLRIEAVEPGEEYGARLLTALKGCDWVCLAGFLRLLPLEVLDAFPKRVLNIHPALLPKFGGKGMYGLKVHQAVLDSGDVESGCTVHFVSGEYDDGEIIAGGRVPVCENDTAEILQARVLEVEHKTYIHVLRSLLNT